MIHRNSHKSKEHLSHHLLENINSLNSNEFFSLIIQLEENDAPLLLRLTQSKDFISLTQKKLTEIPTTQLIKICMNSTVFQTFLIQIVFLQHEDKLYRQNTEREHTEANWSDKLMSLVGSLDGKDILTGVLNHLNDPVRTKKDTYYKPAEAAEIRTEHANYLEGRSSLPVIMSEVADGIYNLVQLSILDQDSKFTTLYEKYIQEIVDIYSVPKSHIFALIIAKYHYRMYVSKKGKNEYTHEDEMIMEVLQDKFNHLLNDDILAINTINQSYKKYDDIFAKLRNILIKKFIVVYEHLDTSTQLILNKIIAEYIQNILLVGEFSGSQLPVVDLVNEITKSDL